MGLEYFESEEFKELCRAEEDAKQLYARECEQFWQDLPYEDKLKAFYTVISKMHKAEVVNRSTYRGALYGTFQFGTEAYVLGMNAGYLEMHNLIFDGMEKKK